MDPWLEESVKHPETSRSHDHAEHSINHSSAVHPLWCVKMCVCGHVLISFIVEFVVVVVVVVVVLVVVVVVCGGGGAAAAAAAAIAVVAVGVCCCCCWCADGGPHRSERASSFKPIAACGPHRIGRPRTSGPSEGVDGTAYWAHTSGARWFSSGPPFLWGECHVSSKL